MTKGSYLKDLDSTWNSSQIPGLGPRWTVVPIHRIQALEEEGGGGDDRLAFGFDQVPN